LADAAALEILGVLNFPPLTPRQYEYSAEQLTECGRMLGGWMKQQG
jgi:hypothetical protein